MSGTGEGASREWLRRPSSLALLASVAVAALGMFTLAWTVRLPAATSMSMSYAVRYENLVAWAALLLACAAAFGAGLLRRRETAGDEAGPVAAGGAARQDAAAPLPRADVLVLAAATAIASAAFAYATFGVPVFDNTFFFDRIAQALAGALPWRDFYFPYGPILLYVPAGLAWLLRRTGSPAVLGYYATLALAQVAGVPLLAWVLGRLPVAPGRRRALFWIVGACALLGVPSGLNYTLVRFLAPVASVLLLAWLASRRPAPGTPTLVAASLGLTAACLAISPEMGVAFALASLGVLHSASPGAGARRLIAPAAEIAGLAALMVPVAVSGMLASLAGGAYRIPVLPSPYVLVYVGTALFAAFSIASVERPFAGASPLAAILVCGLTLAPVALGRADFGHVLWNGLPVLLAGAVLLGRLPRRRFLAWAVVVTIVFPLWSGVSLYASLGSLRDAAAEARKGPLPTGASLDRLLALGPVAMPFGPADALGFEYARRGALLPKTSDENGPADAGQLDADLAQLRLADRIVIPTGVAATVSRRLLAGDIPAARMPAYSGSAALVVMQFPVDLRVKRAPYEGRYELGKAIARDFEPVATEGRYVILERRR